MRTLSRLGVPILLLLAACLVQASAQPIAPDGPPVAPDGLVPEDPLIDPEALSEFKELGPVLDLVRGEEGGAAPPEEDTAAPSEPGFADRVRAAMQDKLLTAGLAGVVAAALGAAGFGLVTRYVSPKEALKNPQRAMLYGFIRATPGAHLKQLSDEFVMKTSSILWHIRKLEAAELVHSDRVNGYRVFYPVDGGIEAKRVSRAITALQNDNAKAIFETIQRDTGCTTRAIAERLSLHGGTARWHLKKLRDHGLLEELVRDDGSRFYNTPLGDRAIEAMMGRPVEPARVLPRRAPVPLPASE